MLFVILYNTSHITFIAMLWSEEHCWSFGFSDAGETRSLWVEGSSRPQVAWLQGLGLEA